MSDGTHMAICGASVEAHEPVVLEWTCDADGFTLHAWPLRLYPTHKLGGIAVRAGIVGEPIKVLVMQSAVRS